MKTTVIQIRISPDKKAAWTEQAKREDKSLSAWIGSMCDIMAERAEYAEKTDAYLAKPPESVSSNVEVLAVRAASPMEPKIRTFERKPVGKIAKMLEGKN